jgi:hypothetical protein
MCYTVTNTDLLLLQSKYFTEADDFDCAENLIKFTFTHLGPYLSVFVRA